MTLHLWESLLKPRGFEINAGKLIRSPSKNPQPPVAGPSHDPPAKEGGGSIISSFRRANSFVGTVKKDVAIKRIAPPMSDGNGGGSSECKTLFSGLKFRTLGEARSTNVRVAIDGCGGRMVSDDEGEEVDYIVVRLVRCAIYLSTYLFINVMNLYTDFFIFVGQREQVL